MTMRLRLTLLQDMEIAYLKRLLNELEGKNRLLEENAVLWKDRYESSKIQEKSIKKGKQHPSPGPPLPLSHSIAGCSEALTQHDRSEVSIMATAPSSTEIGNSETRNSLKCSDSSNAQLIDDVQNTIDIVEGEGDDDDSDDTRKHKQIDKVHEIEEIEDNDGGNWKIVKRKKRVRKLDSHSRPAPIMGINEGPTNLKIALVQYSFITFFIVALPIAPLLAFVNNVIELRLDAKKILTQYRRTVPKKVNGIEEWNTVVQVLTVLGAISNPLLLAFSSSLIPKTIYFLKNNWSLKGYINSTLSEFNLKDAKSIGQDSCLYYGKRYPPSHELKYQRTSDFWHELAVRTIFFVVLENLCLLVSMFLNHNIPVIPRKVEIKLLEDQRILRETKLQRSKSQASLLRLSIDGNKAGPSKTQKV